MGGAKRRDPTFHVGLARPARSARVSPGFTVRAFVGWVDMLGGWIRVPGAEPLGWHGANALRGGQSPRCAGVGGHVSQGQSPWAGTAPTRCAGVGGLFGAVVEDLEPDGLLGVALEVEEFGEV